MSPCILPFFMTAIPTILSVWIGSKIFLLAHKVSFTNWRQSRSRYVLALAFGVMGISQYLAS